ncbi:glycosyltransferase [Cryobacterium sp. Hh38]|uniref:glycosyltransferase n=1 Tax=Cryobacterium sp. Hh38 TaxID=1259156 RepID=UPI00141B3D88|nr:glycosyltransferase [Cryobacterium sp. Hh38]
MTVTNPASIRTVTAYGPRAGSARVRVFDWLDWTGLEAIHETYLNEASNSTKVVVQSPLRVLAAESRLRTLKGKIRDETLLLSRQASPFSNGGVESRLLRQASHGVYDFDDALFHSPKRGLTTPWSKREVWARSVAAADVVIAGNEYLAAAAAELNSSVVVVPSCVNPSEYVPKLDFERVDLPRAVWLGSPSTEIYLNPVAQPLLALNESTGLRLTVISAGIAPLGELESIVDRVEWHPANVPIELARADFGIMPLDDTPWTRGKCAYKLLQYGATALPMIGSPVGANTDVLRRSDGLAASSSDDWVSAMETLVQESPERRARRGNAGLATVTEDYSFAAWAPTWRTALNLT